MTAEATDAAAEDMDDVGIESEDVGGDDDEE